jgi:hypothetical protein
VIPDPGPGTRDPGFGIRDSGFAWFQVPRWFLGSVPSSRVNTTCADNAMNSKDHTTLVAALKAAGLVSTLKGPGPFTMFAPTNAASDKLPKGTVGRLLESEQLAP